MSEVLNALSVLVDNGCDDYTDRVEYADKWIRPRVDGRVAKALADGYVILPVHMYDHSGIILSTGRFSCPWDSGQVGWIVCDKETIEKEFGGDRDKAEAALEAEVGVYSQYVSGDVWGFIAEKRDDEEDDGDAEWEETDSCWGFFGSDVETNGMREHLCDDYADAPIVFGNH